MQRNMCVAVDSTDANLCYRPVWFCRKSFEEDASTIFEDASEEFQSVSFVQGVLENWKSKHNQVCRFESLLLLCCRCSQSYTDAYVSMSLVSLFAPWVRLELLGWDVAKKVLARKSCLNHAECVCFPGMQPSLDVMSWYNHLVNFGVVKGKSNEADPDDMLVPKIVEKLVVPVVVGKCALTRRAVPCRGACCATL